MCPLELAKMSREMESWKNATPMDPVDAGPGVASDINAQGVHECVPQPGTSTMEKLMETKTVPCSKFKKVQAQLEIANGLVDHYKYRLDMEEEKVEEVKKDYEERISEVSKWWKNKIYMEGSRPGILLKRAMQNAKQ